MVTLFISTSCPSCRKAKQWLEKHKISYKIRDILNEPPSKDEMKRILQMTENGAEEIISTRSKIYQELDIEIDTLLLSELYKMIEQYPSLLRRPILMDNKRLQIGYNEDEIRCFLPRPVRTLELNELLKVIND